MYIVLMMIQTTSHETMPLNQKIPIVWTSHEQIHTLTRSVTTSSPAVDWLATILCASYTTRNRRYLSIASYFLEQMVNWNHCRMPRSFWSRKPRICRIDSQSTFESKSCLFGALMRRFFPFNVMKERSESRKRRETTLSFVGFIHLSSFRF